MESQALNSSIRFPMAILVRVEGSFVLNSLEFVIEIPTGRSPFSHGQATRKKQKRISLQTKFKRKSCGDCGIKILTSLTNHFLCPRPSKNMSGELEAFFLSERRLREI